MKIKKKKKKKLACKGWIWHEACKFEEEKKKKSQVTGVAAASGKVYTEENITLHKTCKLGLRKVRMKLERKRAREKKYNSSANDKSNEGKAYLLQLTYLA